MTCTERAEAPKPRVTVIPPAEVTRTNAGDFAPDLDGVPAMIAELRQLCAEPFDTLEIEGDDGAITNTLVVRPADIIAVINDHVRKT